MHKYHKLSRYSFLLINAFNKLWSGKTWLILIFRHQFIEDEFHFLLLCPLYDNLRADYLNDLCANNIMCLQFFYKLMSEYKNKSCFAISKFIVKERVSGQFVIFVHLNFKYKHALQYFTCIYLCLLLSVQLVHLLTC